MRILLISHHYRVEWEYTKKEIPKARKVEEMFKKAWRTQSRLAKNMNVSLFKKRFYNAMNDDLNIPKALKVLEDLAKKIIKSKRSVTHAKAFLTTAFNIFGLTIEYK